MCDKGLINSKGRETEKDTQRETQRDRETEREDGTIWASTTARERKLFCLVVGMF